MCGLRSTAKLPMEYSVNTMNSFMEKNPLLRAVLPDLRNKICLHRLYIGKITDGVFIKYDESFYGKESSTPSCN